MGFHLMTQLIAIMQICTAFDVNPSLVVCCAFLDLSKTFHIVWDKGLLYKLKRNGIKDPLP